MQTFTIQNDGQEIVATNYWDSEHCRRGNFFLTINAGAFRLLVPNVQAVAVFDMATAQEVIVSRGPWPDAGKPDAIEILFEDFSDSPFSIHIGSEQVDRMPAVTDRNKSFVFAIWAPQGKIKELPARYRVVKRLPWLKSWRDTH